MEYHEAADIFPLDEESIGDLAKDIRANGQKVPIELLGGKILDGRRRFLACQKAGVEPIYRDVEPIDPVAYVLSLNLHRRHLTASQRAQVGARARKMYDEAAKARQQAGQKRGGEIAGRGRHKEADSIPVHLPECKGDARDLAGKAVGVSGSLIDRATKVLEKAEPELVEAVDEGRMSVSRAAELADLDEETQREATAQAKFSGGRYRLPQSKSERNGHAPDPDTDPEARQIRGKGITLANEAINCLIRIPKNDALRKRGLQLVTDWIRRNR